MLRTSPPLSISPLSNSNPNSSSKAESSLISMSARRKRSGLFVCFGGGDDPEEEEEEEEEEEAEGIRRRWRSRKIHRRIFDKMKRSASFVTSPKRSNGGKEEANRSEKLALESIFSSDSSPSLGSSSSIASSSSFYSSSSSASFPDPTETKSRPRRTVAAETAAKASRGAATGVFLLLVSLCVMVFCGRLCAILLTSSSLCLAPRRIRAAPSPGKAVDGVSAPSFRRRSVGKGKQQEQEDEEEEEEEEGSVRGG